MKIASITFGFALACGFATAVSAQEKAVGGLGQACKTELSTLCASGAKTGPFVSPLTPRGMHMSPATLILRTSQPQTHCREHSEAAATRSSRRSILRGARSSIRPTSAGARSTGGPPLQSIQQVALTPRVSLARRTFRPSTRCSKQMVGARSTHSLRS